MSLSRDFVCKQFNIHVEFYLISLFSFVQGIILERRAVYKGIFGFYVIGPNKLEMTQLTAMYKIFHHGVIVHYIPAGKCNVIIIIIIIDKTDAGLNGLCIRDITWLWYRSPPLPITLIII